MSQRTSRKRPPPTKNSKPFPWVMLAGSVLLGAALLGIIVYAAMNQGKGFEDPVEKADKAFTGIQVSDDLERGHVQGEVDYPTPVPVGGPHNNVAQQCAVYEEEIAAEHAVHSLEHGAVWITYRPDLPADQVAALSEQVEGNPYGLMSPQPGQTEPILLRAWGRRLSVPNADDGRIGDFVRTYASGPQTPERGAACSGTSATGSSPGGLAPAPVSPVPASPPAASPAPVSPVPAPAASPTG